MYLVHLISFSIIPIFHSGWSAA